ADVDGLVTDLHHAPHDHVLDQVGIEVVALHDRVERERGEIDGVDVLERAVPPPERRTDGVDDDGRGHDGPPRLLDQPVTCTAAGYIPARAAEHGSLPR